MPTEEPQPAPEPLTDLEIHNLEGTMSRLRSGTSTRYGYVQQDTDVVFQAVVRLVRERAELREALAKCDLQEALLREELDKRDRDAEHMRTSMQCEIDGLKSQRGQLDALLTQARKEVADAEDRWSRRQAEQGAVPSDAGRADVLTRSHCIGADWEHSE